MRDGAPMTRWSDTMKSLLNRRECPYLFNCKFPVTRNFFDHICNSDSYLKCHYFAKRVARALPFARMHAQNPMLWLQELAVHDGI